MIQCLETCSVVGLSLFCKVNDVNIFKPHSRRSASTSKAKLCDVPLAEILDKAGWKSESTFAKFYGKNIVEDTFANKVFAVMCSLV